MPIGIVSMTLPPVSDFAFLGLGVWILIASILLMVRGETA